MLKISYLNTVKRTIIGYFFALALVVVGSLCGGEYDAFAYVAISHEPEVPYEVFTITTPLSIEQWYLGTLTQFPELYEFTLTENTAVHLSLKMPINVDLEAIQPVLLLVRDAGSDGVEEIARLPFVASDWLEETDIRSRLVSYSAPPFALELTPGLYRVEVSSPNNEGQYMLVVGKDTTRPSFITSFKTTAALYEFNQVPKIMMLRSSVVYFPLGVFFFLVLLGVTWRYRARLRFS
jgi:hypothetical protein